MKRLIYTLVFLIGLVGQATGQKIYEYGKSADSQYTVVETHSGLSGQLYTDDMNLVAAEVKDSVNRMENVNFRILGCDFYSLIAYDEVGFDSLFNTAYAGIDNDNTDFLFITKENKKDGTINYRSRVKFTGSAESSGLKEENAKNAITKFSDLDEEGIGVVQYRVQQAIEDEATKTGFSIAASFNAEIAGMRMLLTIKKEIEDRTFDPKAFQAPRILKECLDNYAILDFIVTEEPIDPLVGLKEGISKSGETNNPYGSFEFSFIATPNTKFTLSQLCQDVEQETFYNYKYRFDHEPSMKSILYVFEDDYLTFKDSLNSFNESEDVDVTLFYVVLQNGGNSILCTLAKTNGKLIKGIAREQVRFQGNNSATLTYSEDLRKKAALVFGKNGLDGIDDFIDFGEFKEELDDLKAESVNADDLPISQFVTASLEGNLDTQFFSAEIPTYQFLRSRIRSLVNSLNGTVFMQGEPTIRRDGHLERFQNLIYLIIEAKNENPQNVEYYWSGSFSSAREFWQGREFFDGLGILKNVRFYSGNWKVTDLDGPQVPVQGMYTLDLDNPMSKETFTGIQFQNFVGLNQAKQLKYYTISFNFNNGEVQLPFVFLNENKRNAFYDAITSLLGAPQLNEEYFKERAEVIENYIGGRSTIDQIGGLESLGSILYTASSSTFSMFSQNFRKDMLNFFLKDTRFVDIIDESVIDRLFGNIDILDVQENGKTRYEEFISGSFDKELLMKLGESIDNDIRRLEFLQLVTRTHTRYLKKLKSEDREKEVIRGSALKGAYNLSRDYAECGGPISDESYSVRYGNAVETPYNLYHNFNRVDSYYTTVLANGDELEIPLFKYKEDHEGSFHPYDNIFLATNLFSIDTKNAMGEDVKSNMGVVPFIAMGFILQYEKSDENWRNFFTTVEVGLFFTGIGELSAAFRAARVLKTSTTFAQATRVSAGLMEVNAGVFSLACGGDSGTEICEWYRCKARPWIDASALASGAFYLTARGALTRLDAYNTVRAIDNGSDELNSIIQFVRDAKKIDDGVLEVLSKFYKSVDDVDLERIRLLNADLAKVSTNGSGTILSACIADARLFRALDDMIIGNVPFARFNTDYLATYANLSKETRPLILRFSDNVNPSESAIQKFFKDLEDPDFFKFVNDSNNFDALRGMLSHKPGLDLSDITIERANSVFEAIDEIDGAAGILARKWLNRSVGIFINQSKFAKAARFEELNNGRIFNNEFRPCNAWGGNKPDDYFFEQLHVRAVGSEKRIVLDDGILDAVVYYDAVLMVNYRRIKYHDSKLTKGAPWTDNQRNGIIKVFRDSPDKKYIELEVRSSPTYFDDYPNSTIKTTDKIRLYREDVYKSFSNGDGFEILETVKMDKIGFKFE